MDVFEDISLVHLFLCLIFLLAFMEWLINGRKRARAFRRIHGPPMLLLFGSAFQIMASPEVLFKKLRQWSSTYRNLYRQWILYIGIITIYNPEDIEIVLSNQKHNEKGLTYDYLKPWLRDGLLLSKGSKWQIRRKILTPAFHFNILQNFAIILEENSSRMAQDLLKAEYKQKVDVVSLMSNVTLNSICETAMGTKLDEDVTGKGKIYKNAIRDIGKLVIYRITRCLFKFDFIFKLSKAYRDQNKVLEIIRNFPKTIIEERRSYIHEHGFVLPDFDKTKDEHFNQPNKRNMAMLDLLISAEKEGLIDEEGIQEEVDTFMFKGHDTTGMGLTFALLELANNAEIQRKVYNELQDIFGDSERDSVTSDFSQMKYLECCIKETLRLYPPVPIIGRSITEPITLGGVYIPPGNTLLHIHIFDLHRRADLFPEPLVFNPERFTLENCKNRHPYAYIPFSGGSRNCIGQRFAMMEMKSVLSSILRRFELRPITKPEDLVFTTDLVIRTTHPIYVEFVPRK